jgi:hypothetical protein
VSQRFRDTPTPPLPVRYTLHIYDVSYGDGCARMTGPHCAAFWEGGVRGISFVRAPFVPPSLRGQNVSGLAHAVYTANPPRKTHTVYSCTYGLHVSYREGCVCAGRLGPDAADAGGRAAQRAGGAMHTHPPLPVRQATLYVWFEVQGRL